MGKQSELSVTDAEAVEEDEDAAVDFVVAARPRIESMVTVGRASADGTATAGADYTEPCDTLILAPGATTKTASAPIADDIEDAGDETFSYEITVEPDSPETGTVTLPGDRACDTTGACAPAGATRSPWVTDRQRRWQVRRRNRQPTNLAATEAPMAFVVSLGRAASGRLRSTSRRRTAARRPSDRPFRRRGAGIDRRRIVQSPQASPTPAFA